ncbi:CPBP family intramembrane glutamic endopeptidase [Actinorugispora endophytica]|uniref:Membrane protease YdiL (CAAX protease family) n=1 Tax=Actinorugispora endophytica TaxID=1605990 RepID=A0A4R6V6V2_9ACTN|nr:CPBP family intramembrane glutamic endopeptidase [Actinorugispora endophytica]TDQ54237.1 membrane protease YdiL (CAAX protease family) [Actinorugispora endophytica]
MIDTDGPRASRGAAAITVTGIAVYAAAFAWLLRTGTTGVTASADPGATPVSLWASVLPALAAMALARLVPPRAALPRPLEGVTGRRLARETWVLVAAATVFPVLVIGQNQSLWYPLAKVLLLLVVPLAAFRLLRGDAPGGRAIPAPVTWLAPLPAVAAWFLLSQAGPLAPPLTQELPDPVTLAVGSLVTLLTAGVLEEVFYRGWLQTRLEVRYGRWPAILASSLLFAAMHTSHLHGDAVGLGLASLAAFQGVFGLMQGYLWARYRNIWVLVAVHAVVNLVYVDLLVRALGWS